MSEPSSQEEVPPMEKDNKLKRNAVPDNEDRSCPSKKIRGEEKLPERESDVDQIELYNMDATQSVQVAAPVGFVKDAKGPLGKNIPSDISSDDSDSPLIGYPKDGRKVIVEAIPQIPKDEPLATSTKKPETDIRKHIMHNKDVLKRILQDIQEEIIKDDMKSKPKKAAGALLRNDKDLPAAQKDDRTTDKSKDKPKKSSQIETKCKDDVDEEQNNGDENPPGNTPKTTETKTQSTNAKSGEGCHANKTTDKDDDKDQSARGEEPQENVQGQEREEEAQAEQGAKAFDANKEDSDDERMYEVAERVEQQVAKEAAAQETVGDSHDSDDAARPAAQPAGGSKPAPPAQQPPDSRQTSRPAPVPRRPVTGEVDEDLLYNPQRPGSPASENEENSPENSQGDEHSSTSSDQGEEETGDAQAAGQSARTAGVDHRREPSPAIDNTPEDSLQEADKEDEPTHSAPETAEYSPEMAPSYHPH